MPTLRAPWASRLIAASTLLVACSPFASSGAATTVDDGGARVADGSSTDGGSGTADAADAIAPLPCAKQLQVFEETFESFSGSTWEVRRDSGKVDVGSPNEGNFGSGKVLMTEATVGPTDAILPAAILRTIQTPPLAARIELDLAVAELEPYVEFGCALGFRTANNEDVRLILHTQEPDPHNLAFELTEYTSTGPKSAGRVGVGVRPLPLVTRVTTELRHDAGGVGADVWLDGQKVGTIPPAALPEVPNEVGIICGLMYMQPHPTNAKARIAIDNVRVTICPQ